MSRIDKVNQFLKREISQIILREFNDPRFQFITITHVEVSKDLRHAKVYFSVLCDEKQIKKVTEGLQNVRGLVRKFIGKSITFRFTPEINFVYDASIQYGARIEEKIKEIRNELQRDSKTG